MNFFREKFLVFFFVKMIKKIVIDTIFDLNEFYLVVKENKKNFVKKNSWIRNL